MLYFKMIAVPNVFEIPLLMLLDRLFLDEDLCSKFVDKLINKGLISK